MELAFYFPNNEETLIISSFFSIYQSISSNHDEVISDAEVSLILNKLLKRQYLTEKEIIQVITILAIIIIAIDTTSIDYGVDQESARYLLLKMITSHKSVFSEDIFVENNTLFKYTKNIFLKLSEDKIILEEEKKMIEYINLLFL